MASQEHIYALKGHLFRIFALFYLPGKDDFLKCWVEEPRRKKKGENIVNYYIVTSLIWSLEWHLTLLSFPFIFSLAVLGTWETNSTFRPLKGFVFPAQLYLAFQMRCCLFRERAIVLINSYDFLMSVIQPAFIRWFLFLVGCSERRKR